MVKSKTMLACDGKAVPATLDLLGALNTRVDAGDPKEAASFTCAKQ